MVKCIGPDQRAVRAGGTNSRYSSKSSTGMIRPPEAVTINTIRCSRA